MDNLIKAVNINKDLDNWVNQVMMALNIEETMMSIEDQSGLLDRLAPQELDKLATVLYQGLKECFCNIGQNRIKDTAMQHRIIQNIIEEQLKEVGEDLGLKDLETKFDAKTFANRVLVNLGPLNF